jgi:hypothetical protein
LISRIWINQRHFGNDAAASGYGGADAAGATYPLAVGPTSSIASKDYWSRRDTMQFSSQQPVIIAFPKRLRATDRPGPFSRAGIASASRSYASTATQRP